MKSATLESLEEEQQMLNFNPRTHEECDDNTTQKVSIGVEISIHAPMKSATTRNLMEAAGARNFNPRTHEECDIMV